MTVEEDIFRQGSTTYYWSSKFFPTAVRGDVFRLYSFVRVIDDYVDTVPQQPKMFYAIRQLWDEVNADSTASTTVVSTDSTMPRVVKNMLYVTRKYNFDLAWIDAFFDSMQMDLDGRTYATIDDTLEYIYGSAEVIGLMMAKIMDLPEDAMQSARLQGRAMQWINFLRDIAEDSTLNRTYIPTEDLKLFGLQDLSKAEAIANTEKFTKLIHYEIERYEAWQAEANNGFRYIPRRLRVPLQTAVDMYNWTARRIFHDPQLVYAQKIRPSRLRVVSSATRHSL
jgi:phytoene synthase